jgi:hypothetical protein
MAVETPTTTILSREEALVATTAASAGSLRSELSSALFRSEQRASSAKRSEGCATPAGDGAPADAAPGHAAGATPQPQRAQRVTARLTDCSGTTADCIG